jgi:hypothetical protein
MNQEEKTNIFHQRCGEILRMVLNVESMFDFFISNYFVCPQNYKTFFLRDEIILQLSFERKIHLFKEICQCERISGNKLKEISEAVNYIRNVRNKIAHSEAYVEDSKNAEISLWSAKSIKHRKDSIQLTEELVKEISDKSSFAIRQIIGVHLELFNSDRKLSEEIF